MNTTEKFKEIKNEGWLISSLKDKVVGKKILKPKYQRKRKWFKLPNPRKESIPSEREYIIFLCEHRNTGAQAITFGQDGDKIYNIDGNNRINAIMRYLTAPFELFPEMFESLMGTFKSNVNDKVICTEFENIVYKMTYDDIISFNYRKYFIENGHQDFYTDHLNTISGRDKVEDSFDALKKNMLIHGKDRFDMIVTINVSIYYGYTTEELAKLFGKINKYSSNLSEQETMASKLYNITNFSITNKELECSIRGKLKKYYEDRTIDEVLPCYIYENTDINAFDFMVSYQNYCNEKCSLIQKTDEDGVSLFFKIYKIINPDSIDVSFTTEKVNQFIDHITKVTELLTTLEKIIFMEKLTNNSQFDSVNKKLKSLKKNNLFVIISFIIGSIINKVDDKDIIKHLQICILYHFFVSSISDQDKREEYKVIDNIVYEAGGSYIDNKAKELYTRPINFYNKITKEKMKIVLDKLVSENITNRQYIKEKDDKKKRRVRKIHEAALMYYYYKNKVPIEQLENDFEMEHIFPFSSEWSGLLDIDRLGNTLPIIKELNRQRSNKHINEYRKLDKHKFLKFIEYIPKTDEYDKIISHAETKPNIINSARYNEFCTNNETMLIECFLDKLFTQ
jgi:hypothetical protein